MSPLEELQSGQLVVSLHLQDKLTSPLTLIMSNVARDVPGLISGAVQNAVTFPQRFYDTIAQNPVGLGLSRSDYTDIPGDEPANPSVGMAADLAMNMVGAPMFTTNPATLGSGAVRGTMRGMSDKTINSFDDIRAILEKHPEAFVRWSVSHKHDLKPGAVSKDYASGQTHGGLSALGIDSSFSDDQIFRFLRDYSYLTGPRGAKTFPHLYTGKRVGRDSDGADSIVPDQFLGRLSDDFIKFIGDDNNRQRMRLVDELKRGKSALALYEKEPPDFIPTWTPERVAEIERKLAELGGPPTMPGASPFPNPNSASAGIGPAGGTVLGSGSTDKRTAAMVQGLRGVKAANENEFDLTRAIENRIRNNPELAAKAAEPMQAASNPFVQRTFANAERRSKAGMDEIMASLPEKPTADDILRAVMGLVPK